VAVWGAKRDMNYSFPVEPLGVGLSLAVRL
jgi:hypothetical protein